MPQFDLSTLDAQELRDLLASARRQGQAAQSYEILKELQARREGGPRRPLRPKKRTPAKPRTILLELGDPLPQEARREEVEDDLPPLTLDPPEPLRPSRAQPPPEPPPARRQRWAHWGALIFAVGLAGGTAFGWIASQLGGPPAAAPAKAPALAEQPLPVQTAAAAMPAAAPLDASAAPPPPDALVPTPPPPAPPPPQASEASSPSAAAVQATQQAAADARPPASPAAAPEPAPAETPAATETAEAAPPSESGCVTQPTPADRTICAEPRLKRLQAELRRAYAEALAAHQDRALLREHQLAWRDTRNEVRDPDQLARLYQARIEKLKAATADALRQR